MDLSLPLKLSFFAEIDIYDPPREDLTPLLLVAWQRVGSQVLQRPYYYWGRRKVIPAELNPK